MSCCGDIEPATIWQAKHRRARKPRQCGVCHGPIRARQSYLRIDMLFDGAWSHQDVCDRCERLCDGLQRECGSTVYDAECLYEILYYGDHAHRWDGWEDEPDLVGHAEGILWSGREKSYDASQACLQRARVANRAREAAAHG